MTIGLQGIINIIAFFDPFVLDLIIRSLYYYNFTDAYLLIVGCRVAREESKKVKDDDRGVMHMYYTAVCTDQYLHTEKAN